MIDTWLIRIKIVKKISQKYDLIADLIMLIGQLIMFMGGRAFQRQGNLLK